jgi:hypothetical protein
VKVIEDAEQNLSPWQEWMQIETDVPAITNTIERISNEDVRFPHDIQDSTGIFALPQYEEPWRVCGKQPGKIRR